MIHCKKGIELLILHFDSLKHEHLRSLIKELGEDYARMFIKQNKPSIEYTHFNATLVDKLKSFGLISSFSINNKKNEIKVIAKYTED